MTGLSNKAKIEKLIEEAKHGNMQAFDSIVKNYYGLVMHYLLGRGVNFNDAEDVAQEAFINLFRKIDQVNSVSTFSAWLLRIAHNRLVDKIRKETKLDISQNEFELENLVSDSSPEEVVLSDCNVGDVFDGLKSKERVVVDLRVFQGLPFAEIGEIMDMTEGSVRLVFHRVMIKLREKLGSELSKK